MHKSNKHEYADMHKLISSMHKFATIIIKFNLPHKIYLLVSDSQCNRFALFYINCKWEHEQLRNSIYSFQLNCIFMLHLEGGSLEFYTYSFHIKNLGHMGCSAGLIYLRPQQFDLLVLGIVRTPTFAGVYSEKKLSYVLIKKSEPKIFFEKKRNRSYSLPKSYYFF